MTDVSIIVPVYNGESHIKRCIESILNQEYEDFEIIAIDDGSKDNSLNILKSFKDKRLRVYTQKNMGVAKTRGKGVSLSKGEFIFFIDNDDFIDTDYISTFMKYKEYDVVIGGYKRCLEDKVMLYKHIKNKPFSKFENMAPWCKMIRKSILVNNNIEFFSYPIGEDVIFNLNLYSKSNNIKTIDYLGYNWFFNNESVSNTKQKKFDKDIRILLDEMIKYDINSEIHYYIKRYEVWYLLFSGRNVSSKDFIKEYNKLNRWYEKNNFNKVLTLKKINNMEQDFKNKIFISIFYLIDKFKLMNIFSKIYCKGR